MTTLVKRVEKDAKETIEQSFQTVDNNQIRCEMSTSSAKAQKESFLLSVNDINSRNLSFKTIGSHFKIALATAGNLRYIERKKDDVLQDYDNSFDLLFDDVDDARDAVESLVMLVDKSKDEHRNRQFASESGNNGFQDLTNVVKPFSNSNYNIEQSLKGNGIMVYEMSDKTAKTVKNLAYRFNLADFKEKADIKVRGKQLFVVIETNGKKLVKVEENGIVQNYDDNVDIICASVETAKRTASLLENAIKTIIKNPVSSCDTSSSMTWLINNVNDAQAQDNQYTLEHLEKGIDSKLKLTTISKVSKDKTREEVLEFSLRDINERKIELYTSGKTLAVQVATTGNADYIKRYVDGKPEKFISKFTVLMNEVEKARCFVRVFQTVVTNCKK